jgi:hypothetical protein
MGGELLAPKTGRQKTKSENRRCTNPSGGLRQMKTKIKPRPNQLPEPDEACRAPWLHELEIDPRAQRKAVHGENRAATPCAGNKNHRQGPPARDGEKPRAGPSRRAGHEAPGVLLAWTNINRTRFQDRETRRRQRLKQQNEQWRKNQGPRPTCSRRRRES